VVDVSELVSDDEWEVELSGVLHNDEGVGVEVLEFYKFWNSEIPRKAMGGKAVGKVRVKSKYRQSCSGEISTTI
jgi:hypothetical protein